MAQLQSTNVVGTLCVNGVALGGGKDFKVCCITTTGNFTPSSDLVDGDGHVEAVLVGGGGGGGTFSGQTTTVKLMAGPGGGGEVKYQIYPVTSSEAHCTIIGAGGNTGSIDCTDNSGWSSKVDPDEGGNTSIDGAKYLKAEGGGKGSHRFCRCGAGADCSGTPTKNGAYPNGSSSGGAGKLADDYQYERSYYCYNFQGEYFVNCYIKADQIKFPETYCLNCAPQRFGNGVDYDLHKSTCGCRANPGVKTPFGNFGVGSTGTESALNNFFQVEASVGLYTASCYAQSPACDGCVCGGGGAAGGICTPFGGCLWDVRGGKGADGVIVLSWKE